MARCSLGSVVADGDRRRVMAVEREQVRPRPQLVGMVTSFPHDPIRSSQGAGCQAAPPGMMMERCIVGARRGWHQEAVLPRKRNVLSLSAEMTLGPVTFSTASHHSVLFFILPGYTSASEIRDLLLLGSPSPPGLNLFSYSATRCNQNLSPKYPKRAPPWRGPAETLSWLLNSWLFKWRPFV